MSAQRPQCTATLENQTQNRQCETSYAAQRNTASLTQQKFSGEIKNHSMKLMIKDGKIC